MFHFKRSYLYSNVSETTNQSCLICQQNWSITFYFIYLFICKGWFNKSVCMFVFKQLGNDCGCHWSLFSVFGEAFQMLLTMSLPGNLIHYICVSLIWNNSFLQVTTEDTVMGDVLCQFSKYIIITLIGCSLCKFKGKWMWENMLVSIHVAYFFTYQLVYQFHN